MKQENILPVILAGGVGSRLWPMSRKSHPKQLLRLCGNQTMLQETVTRLADSYQAPVVICGEEYRFMVAEQLREVEVEPTSLILEPVGRNTAPAVALAALQAISTGNDPIVLVLAADHLIEDVDALQSALRQGANLVQHEKLITFGVVPSHPETGYGYLKSRSKSDPGEVQAFIEKPSPAKAKEYFDSGDYFWNAGMFMFRASQYLNELEKYRPDIFKACQAAAASFVDDMYFSRMDRQLFEACPDESIDYAIMEQAEDVWVVPLDAGWSDVGSWASLREIEQPDKNGNRIRGDVIEQDTTNCYVRSEDRLVAALGLNNLILIDTKDALLVANADQSQNVKKIVDVIKASKRPEWDLHREVFRPWGKYESIGSGERYQVKRITVKPGEKLSVQMHHHRAEHWVVVSGRAHVRRGEEDLVLVENESVYIPVECVHSLENRDKEVLEIIEIQSGSYLGEDDIVRFEDKYGRTDPS